MKKILVVDDDADILQLLELFFNLNGFDTKVSATCEEGLDIFYSFLPDVLLLDINVGASDGREMCRIIKSNPAYHHIPVIFISANRANLKSYKDFGAVEGIEKPFDITDLLTTVNAVISLAN